MARSASAFSASGSIELRIRRAESVSSWATATSTSPSAATTPESARVLGAAGGRVVAGAAAACVPATSGSSVATLQPTTAASRITRSPTPTPAATARRRWLQNGRRGASGGAADRGLCRLRAGGHRGGAESRGEDGDALIEPEPRQRRLQPQTLRAQLSGDALAAGGGQVRDAEGVSQLADAHVEASRCLDRRPQRQRSCHCAPPCALSAGTIKQVSTAPIPRKGVILAASGSGHIRKSARPSAPRSGVSRQSPRSNRAKTPRSVRMA